MNTIINMLIAVFLVYLVVSLLCSAYRGQKRDELRHHIEEKLKKDGWVDISFEKDAQLVIARKPDGSWQLLNEEGKTVSDFSFAEKPEFHDGFWYCKRRGDDWNSCDFYNDRGIPVQAHEIRKETKQLLCFEESKPEQRCLDCIHCVDTTTWFDALTLQSSDYRFSCKEGLVNSLMDDAEAVDNDTAHLCAKYRRW